MSPLETAVMRLWIEHEGHPAEFAAVMERYAAKAKRAGKLGYFVEQDAEPFLTAMREIDMEAGR